jgi:hypothetical protein
MFSARFEVDDFITDLSKTEQQMDQALGFAWADQGASAAQASRHNGFKDRTGNLSNSMNYKIERRGPFDYRVIVSAGAYYALWVNEKTKPHRIPKVGSGKGPLRFFWAKVGRWVTFQSVWHPGTKGAYWTTRIALQYGGWNIPQALQAAVDRVASAA